MRREPCSWPLSATRIAAMTALGRRWRGCSKAGFAGRPHADAARRHALADRGLGRFRRADLHRRRRRARRRAGPHPSLRSFDGRFAARPRLHVEPRLRPAGSHRARPRLEPRTKNRHCVCHRGPRFRCGRGHDAGSCGGRGGSRRPRGRGGSPAFQGTGSRGRICIS